MTNKLDLITESAEDLETGLNLGERPDTDILDKITDIYVPVLDTPAESVNNAFYYNGVGEFSVVEHGLQAWVMQLFIAADKCKKEADGDDIDIEFDNYRFRAHWQRTIENDQVNLRVLGKQPPSLDDLTFVPMWRELFMSNPLAQGGLVLISGETGSGKSTTSAALVRSWLEAHGGFCQAIENPPEYLLQGKHGEGRCVQSPVGAGGYKEAIRSALRAYPTISSGGGIMMVGECRDDESAAQLVQNAVNGFRVITTVHAGSPISAIQRIISLAASKVGGEEQARQLVSSGLRISVTQKIEITDDESKKGWDRGRVSGQLLYSKNPKSAVANAISEGKFTMLEGILTDQTTQIKLAGDKGKMATDLIGELK